VVLDEVEGAFEQEWIRAHGLSEVKGRAMLGGSVLTVMLENALTPAELALGRGEASRALLDRYLDQLVDMIYPTLAHSVESVLHRHVTGTGVNVDSEAGCVIFTIHLDMAGAYQVDW
jgi:uncharacterized protein YbcI